MEFENDINDYGKIRRRAAEHELADLMIELGYQGASNEDLEAIASGEYESPEVSAIIDSVAKSVGSPIGSLRNEVQAAARAMLGHIDDDDIYADAA